MDELFKRVSEKTGISEDKAKAAITIVLSFMKEKLPEPIGGQIESALSGGNPSGTLGDIASKARSLFDK